MTFIECFPTETDSALLEVVRESYSLAFKESLPSIRFGQLIEWNGRLFRELCVSAGADRMWNEEKMFVSAMAGPKRATVQMGCFHGEIFTTPPSAGMEIAARVIDDGLQTTVRPFAYERRA